MEVNLIVEEAAVLILLTEQSQQSPLFIGLRLSAGRPSQVYHLIFTSNVNVLIFTSEVKIWDITLNLSWELGTVPVSKSISLMFQLQKSGTK